MGLLKEFRDFALRGNVVDMAVGVIIGQAFQKIVTATINDVIMPPIGWAVSFTGKAVSFKDLYYALPPVPETLQNKSLEEMQKAGHPVLAFGSFIQSVADFLILAVCVFIMVKMMNVIRERIDGGKDKSPAATPEDVLLLREIRDLLASKQPPTAAP